MKLLALLFILTLHSVSLLAQTQTVRGRIFDAASQQPLIGVVLLVQETDINTMTDENGNFVLENVPVGRQIIQTQYLGYEEYLTDNLIISSTKETFLDIPLTERIEVTGEVVVTASGGADGVGNKPINDLSVISTRSFSVEETKRYAASVDDPGRMAVALPGVQTDQDNENDVVIRGNSAFGVLWKLEDLQVTNPSHFARTGSTGGGITVFSASVLGNTDFATGGFAAEYGNALSGVFDMRFRKGSVGKREYSAKIGLVGLGFSAEGPFKKGRSSYLVNYRYSTLGILNAMGLYVVRENVANNFQDLSFNLSFTSKDNKSEFKVFGVGGLSDEVWSVKDTSEWRTTWDYQFDNNGSNLGILGASFRRLLDDKSYLRLTVGTVFNHIREFQYEPMITDLNFRDTLEDKDSKTLRSQMHLTYSNKINTKFRLKAGLSTHFITYWLDVSERSPFGYRTFLDEQGTHAMIQGYALGSYRPTPKLTINLGVHSLLMTLNNTYSVEPRLALQYKPFKNTTLTAAYGLHGQALPMGTYLLRIPNANGTVSQPNKDLEMIKMHHAIVGLQQSIGAGFRFNLEGYYQYAFDVPIGADSLSSFSYLNQRDGYGQEAMVSEGVGRNYGVDMTVEKAFSRQFFMLVTGSLFWSQYKAKPHTEWQSTRTDRRWGSTIMGGYEFAFKNNASLQLGLKTRLSGGLRFTPADIAASQAAGVYVEDATSPFSESADLYYRIDTRFAYRKNGKKISYIIALDIQNVTNNRNIRSLAFDRQNNELIYRYESGLLPVLSFQIDF
jgi:hypothetical protein